MPTLLLSDDSVIVQRVVAMTFGPENIAVTMASDGEEAIARISKERPDIVLAAIATPKRSGYDVSAFVKSTPGLASIPVLLLAGAFEPVDEQRAAQVRCDGVLVKPFEPSQLLARVRELLSAAARQPVAPDRPEEDLDKYFERLDAVFAKRPVLTQPPADDADVPTLDSVLKAAASGQPPATPAPAAPIVTEALVDEVTRRVVERLGMPAVRAVVADVVADVAERLIREEITRIRGKGTPS